MYLSNKTFLDFNHEVSSRNNPFDRAHSFIGFQSVHIGVIFAGDELSSSPHSKTLKQWFSPVGHNPHGGSTSDTANQLVTLQLITVANLQLQSSNRKI